MQQETQSYFSFLSSLIGKKNDLRDLKAYGSDGELPLLNALVAAFPDAIGLRCFIHMKDNIERHLHNKLHVKSEVKSAIIHDIFGHVVGDTRVNYFKWQCISYTTVCIVVYYLQEYYMYTMDYVKDGAYFCYCAYVLRISRYSGFPLVMLTNTVIFLHGLKLSGKSRS